MNKKTRRMSVGGKNVAREVHTVFNAIRDNGGEGIKAKKLISILKKTDAVSKLLSIKFDEAAAIAK